MKRVTRKTTGMKRPRMTARNAPKLTSRPIVPPSTATTPATVEESCSTTDTSMDICAVTLEEAASLEAGSWVRMPTGTNALALPRKTHARIRLD